MLCFPGICLALKNILYFKAAKTRRRTSFIMTLSLDVVLCMMSTTAALSVKNNILWFVKTFQQPEQLGKAL